MCALGPHAIIGIEEKFSMCFANDKQILHTLYLSNDKQIKITGIPSLVLMGSWCLWRYYGFIILNMYIRVRALKYCIKNRVVQNDILI
jgi:hypothetical protein